MKGRKSGPVFVTEQKARVPLPAADLDPSGRARLSYQQAAALFSGASGGATLHQLRRSTLTQDAELGTGTPMLMARSLAKYARSAPRRCNGTRPSATPPAGGNKPGRPVRADQEPPWDSGTVPLTVPETRRLRLPAHPRQARTAHSSGWTRRHHGRARWYHQRTRLARDAEFTRMERLPSLQVTVASYLRWLAISCTILFRIDTDPTYDQGNDQWMRRRWLWRSARWRRA